VHAVALRLVAAAKDTDVKAARELWAAVQDVPERDGDIPITRAVRSMIIAAGDRQRRLRPLVIADAKGPRPSLVELGTMSAWYGAPEARPPLLQKWIREAVANPQGESVLDALALQLGKETSKLEVNDWGTAANDESGVGYRPSSWPGWSAMRPAIVAGLPSEVPGDKASKLSDLEKAFLIAVGGDRLIPLETLASSISGIASIDELKRALEAAGLGQISVPAPPPRADMAPPLPSGEWEPDKADNRLCSRVVAGTRMNFRYLPGAHSWLSTSEVSAKQLVQAAKDNKNLKVPQTDKRIAKILFIVDQNGIARSLNKLFRTESRDESEKFYLDADVKPATIESLEDWPVNWVDCGVARSFAGSYGCRLPTVAEWEEADKADVAADSNLRGPEWKRVYDRVLQRCGKDRSNPRIFGAAAGSFDPGREGQPECRTKEDECPFFRPVRPSAPNFVDLRGNVAEWVTEKMAGSNGSKEAVKIAGGSAISVPPDENGWTPSGQRDSSGTGASYSDVGFRLAAPAGQQADVTNAAPPKEAEALEDARKAALELVTKAWKVEIARLKGVGTPTGQTSEAPATPAPPARGS
jgi:formylglycine-generating enzyme required for sulfatase activity